MSQRILVMTGGTRGFGRRMLERLLAEQPGWRVILLARPSTHVDELAAAVAAPERLTIVDADLASLSSVARAIEAVRTHLGGKAIDAIALNAGIQVIEGDRQSADGYEISFAVNHLAHFFIAASLAPNVKTGGRVVFTSSVVHDPEAYCLIGITRAQWQAPDVLADNARAQMHLIEGVERGEARYSASKLLNLMTARYFAASEPRFSTYAFNPNVVPGTDIARERNIFQILGWKYIMPALAPILPGARTMGRSGSDLLWLVTEADAEALRGQYVDGRTVRPGSDESRDTAKIEAVVAYSRALIARHLATPLASPAPEAARAGSAENSALRA